MLGKIFTTGSLILAAAAASYAQSFSLEHKVVSETTTGTEDGNNGDFVTLINHLTNTSTETYKYRWNLITPVDVPTGWVLQGFCDNELCRATGGPWTTGSEEESGDLDPGEESVFKLQVCAPVSAANGTLTVKVRAHTRDYVDTATYILTKDPTGLSTISLKDERVVLSPNPANDHVTIFADKSLNAEKATVFNMVGRVQQQLALTKGSESTVLDVNALPAGIYMVRITDNKGNVITSRKLTKQ